MKTTSLFALAAAATTLALVPMPTAAKDSAWGVYPTAGLTFGDFYGEDVTIDTQYNVRLAYGGGFIVQDWAGLGFVIELLFQDRGVSYNVGPENGPSGKGLLSWDLSYFSIPILGRYAFPVGKVAQVFLQGGISWDMLRSAKVTLDFEDKALPNESTDYTEVTPDMDFGLILGAGIEYRAWCFDIRQTWGTGTIDNDDFDQGDKDIKTSTLSLLLAYRFGPGF